MYHKKLFHDLYGKTTYPAIRQYTKLYQSMPVDKKLRIVGIAAAVAFSVWVLTSPSDPLPVPPPGGGPDERVEVVADNLEKPRYLAIYNNDVFITEREGLIRLVHNGTLLDEPVAVLRAVEDFDAGLSGIAVHPDFDVNGLLYVYITYRDMDAIYNRILEVTVKDARLVDAQTVLEGIPASRFTNGGVIKFGPDGMLYIGTGTPSESSHLPQDIGSLAGKILRINPDGTIPVDNPFSDSPVYSMGHRSPRGMAWDASGQLYMVDAGPEKNDEINLIVPGGNYGWPDSECTGEHMPAIICYDPAIEPGGMIFSAGPVAGEGNVVLASMRATSLFELDVDEGLSSQEVLLGGVGRIRDVVQTSDGIMYVITSNTDGKGFPVENDDLLLRVRK